MRLEEAWLSANFIHLRPGPGIESRRVGARSLLALLLFLCGDPAALAATTTKLYEWRDAQGVVSYSQTPPPPGTRGATSREIETRSFTPAQAAAIRSHLAGLDATQAADALRFRRQVDAADKVVAEAVQALLRAERAFRVGRVPLAGERVGNARGGSRLRPEYFARQKQLELAVEQLRTKLNDAYGARNAVTP